MKSPIGSRATQAPLVAGESLAALLVTALFAGGALAQDKLNLTLAHGNPPTIPTTYWFNHLATKLGEYSQGRITVNHQGAGTLCSEHKCVEQAKLGQIDIGSVSGGNIGAFGPAVDILNLPYIFK